MYLATDSKTLSSSGATFVKFLLQKAYLGFLISSMKVINKPQGCGLEINENNPYINV
jgi:hypothetical protein